MTHFVKLSEGQNLTVLHTFNKLLAEAADKSENSVLTLTLTLL